MECEGKVQFPVSLTLVVVSDHPDVPVKSWQALSSACTVGFSLSGGHGIICVP